MSLLLDLSLKLFAIVLMIEQTVKELLPRHLRFEIGDIVRIKSGSPKMMVVDMDELDLWISRNHKHSKTGEEIVVEFQIPRSEVEHTDPLS